MGLSNRQLKTVRHGEVSEAALARMSLLKACMPEGFWFLFCVSS